MSATDPCRRCTWEIGTAAPAQPHCYAGPAGLEGPRLSSGAGRGYRGAQVGTRLEKTEPVEGAAIALHGGVTTALHRFRPFMR